MKKTNSKKTAKSANIYTKEVIKHFQNPHNYGRLKDPDGIGKVGNLACGDVLWLYIKVGENKKGKEIIKDISFETFGCVAALATSSAVTDLAKRKTLPEALAISKNKVIESLRGLPPVKVHCSLLATEALAEAVYDYLSKNKKKIPSSLEARHLRNAKQEAVIEEKYHQWVEIEEKMHGSQALRFKPKTKT
ncbi:MAG: iron-sulfur cluster assembly scaffold protein [bacterium]